MTDIETAVYTFLQTKSAVTSLSSTRIYPDALPQTYKTSDGAAATYHEISGNTEAHLRNESGVCQTRLQVQCFASTASAARGLREQIRLALTSKRGSLGGLFVCGVQTENKFGRYDHPSQGENTGRYVRSIDFLIDHLEEIPAR